MSEGNRTNLLQEIITVLAEHGKTVNDVRWVGSSDGTKAIDWEQFAKIADVTYDAGFGDNEVNGSLVVVGYDWWLSRGEYDGSEWWDFQSQPIRSPDCIAFNNALEIRYLETWTK